MEEKIIKNTIEYLDLNIIRKFELICYVSRLLTKKEFSYKLENLKELFIECEYEHQINWID